MERIIIDDINKLKNILISFNIGEEIFNHASKMDLNIEKMFYDKIINDYSDKTLDEVTRNLLGVYGNYIATLYYKKIYKDTKNEVPIIDDNGKEITRADISFTDGLGKKTYVEVKAAKQIIDNIRNYVDLDEDLSNCYSDKDSEIIKYKMIGKKLITQVKKLSKTGANVIVAIFDGCYMDDIIKDELKDLNAKINIINMNINDLEEEIKRKLILARNYVIKNTILDIETKKGARK